MERKLIFFDLETTGVDPLKDRIVEISIFIEDLIDVTYLVNPTVPIPKEASDVHGITDEDVKDKPKFYEIAKEIYDIFDGCDIAGYNSNHFDIPMLMKEFERVNLELDLKNVNLIDVLAIERKINPNTLSEVYKRYMGKELEGAHGAGADTKATYEIYKKQLELLPEKISLSRNNIEKFYKDDSNYVDVMGKLVYDKHDNVCWNFGKNRGKPVKNDKGYLMWFLGNDIPVDTRQILKEFI